MVDMPQPVLSVEEHHAVVARILSGNKASHLELHRARGRRGGRMESRMEGRKVFVCRVHLGLTFLCVRDEASCSHHNPVIHNSITVT
jgi:hypothetical protein